MVSWNQFIRFTAFMSILDKSMLWIKPGFKKWQRGPTYKEWSFQQSIPGTYTAFDQFELVNETARQI